MCIGKDTVEPGAPDPASKLSETFWANVVTDKKAINKQ
jgi:hypothetical protein